MGANVHLHKALVRMDLLQFFSPDEWEVLQASFWRHMPRVWRLPGTCLLAGPASHRTLADSISTVVTTSPLSPSLLL